MRKIIVIIICYALSMTLTGCENVRVSDNNDISNADNVIKWFDCLNGDEMVWDGIREYDLDEFSGVTFCWQYEHLEAVTEEETVTLYTNIYLKGDTERRGFFVSGKEDAAWREKGRREWLVLIRY